MFPGKRNTKYTSIEIIAFIFIFFLLAIFLSGCNEIHQNKDSIILDENLITGDTDKVGILNYTITTVCLNLNDTSTYNKSGFYHKIFLSSLILGN